MGIFIGINDNKWNNIIENTRYDFYQLPEYVKLEAKWINSEPFAYYTELNSKKVLIPLLLREIEINNKILQEKDAISPYGYPGVISSDQLSDNELKEILEEYSTEGANKNIVSTFLRLHPITNNYNPIKNEWFEVEHKGYTVSIDLQESVENLFSKTRVDHRQDIRKLLKMGFHEEYNNWENLDIFTEVYQSNMFRVNAQKKYFYDLNYFKELKECLDTKIVLCTIVDSMNEVACAGLFTNVSGIQQFHLSGTVERYLKLSPAKLMIFEMIKWGKENGATIFHLGGGLGSGKDGLYKFKSGFSTHEHEFKVIKIINNKIKYNELSQMVFSSIEETKNYDFFPLYRIKH
jgi:hypothetical protein